MGDAGQPAFRVFYQDAPTNAPIGHVPPAILGSTPVDLALLTVGSSNAVENAPTAVIENLRPRFVLSGHWEDFFQDAGTPPQPLPFLDLDTYVQRAEAALAAQPVAGDGELLVDGVEQAGRHVLVQPASWMTVPARR
jgi:hypothetical protein